MSVTYIPMTVEQINEVADLADSKAVRELLQELSKDSVLTTSQVAKKINKSTSTAQKMMATGKIPRAFQIGIAWRISEYDLNKYIDNLKTK
jgi:excisionase family DNA binding protein